jgi:hypothetical protein
MYVPALDPNRTSFHRANTKISASRREVWKLFASRNRQNMWTPKKSPLTLSFHHKQQEAHVLLSFHSQAFKAELQGDYREIRQPYTLELRGKLQDGRNGGVEHKWQLQLHKAKPSKTNLDSNATNIDLSLTTTSLGGRIAHINSRQTDLFWQKLVDDLLLHIAKTALDTLEENEKPSRSSFFSRIQKSYRFVFLFLVVLGSLFLFFSA